MVNNKVYKEKVVALLKKADVGIFDFSIEDKLEEIPETVLDMILNDSKIPAKAKETIKNNPVSHSVEVSMMHSTSHG